MSSQRGNHERSRPQKHKNRSVFKNTLHDTSARTKFINNIQISDVCMRCKEIIEWKIKYKKYKPLSAPKKCVRCEQRTVKKAYHVMCGDCGKKFKVCTKCCQSKEIVEIIPDKEPIKLDDDMQAIVQTLPLGKKRSFLRFLSKKEKEEKPEGYSKENLIEELMEKLNSLKVIKNDDDDCSDFDDDDEGLNECSEDDD